MNAQQIAACLYALAIAAPALLIIALVLANAGQSYQLERRKAAFDLLKESADPAAVKQALALLGEKA